MREADRERFAKCMTMAFAALGQSFSAAQLEMWWLLLDELDIEQVEQALRKHLLDPETGQFPPKPADIVKHSIGTHNNRALRAWSAVYYAIVHVGPYPSVAFDDAITHHVIAQMGGWEKLCMMAGDELPFRQRDFERAYVAACHQPPREYLRYLPGICERENRTAGYPTEQPVMIGNPELVRRVMLGGIEHKPAPKVTHLSEVRAMLSREPEHG